MDDRYRPPTPDAASVRDLLTAVMGPGVDAVEAIRAGEWSTPYRFRWDGRWFVVRFSRLREDFDKDRIAATWSSPALPIPRILHLGEAEGAWFAVSEQVEGGHLDALDGDGLRLALPALFRALDALRAVVPPGPGYGGWDETGRGRHATWQDALLDVGTDDPDRRGGGWRAALEASPVAKALFDETFERMKLLLDLVPDARHVVHCDLVNRNVLVTDDRITAVLDWGSSVYGDFLLDVAWLTYFAPWFRAWSAIDFEDEATRHYAEIGLAVPRLTERLRCYELYIGLSHLAYSAVRGRPEAVEWNAQRTREVIQATEASRGPRPLRPPA